MKKISDLDYSAKDSFVQGLVTLLFAVLLMAFGSRIPRLAFQVLLAWLLLSGVWALLTGWFKPKESRESIWISFAKLTLALYALNRVWLENTVVYLLLVPIALYQLFTALVHLVTWFLYRKNAIRPRLNHLIDGIWIGAIGIYSLSPFHDAAHFEFFLLGFYLFGLGLSSLRDAFLFNAEWDNKQLKRHKRVMLPIFLTALVPAVTLAKVNRFLRKNGKETADVIYNQSKEGREAVLEVFVHTAETSLFSAIGHVDLCYKGRVISYGSYDQTSERLFGTVGDGVLYKCDRESYIALCKRESQKTLFGYGIALNEQQIAAVEERFKEIDSLLLPWQPSSDLLEQASGLKDHSYAYKIQTEADGQLYKFVKSKFKTYFVLSTNCVLLADSILGRAGTDILDPDGFIAPGTYQAYLDSEYDRPHSLVVSKKMY